MSYACSSTDVLNIARKAIKIFAHNGLKCCLVGSVASYAYGVSRTPNDVDLVVLTERYDQETLKQMLVRLDANFYLVNSRNIHATYKVLWYRFPLSYPGKRCKVDVLVPGTMNIPNVPSEYLVSKAPHDLPLMPLIPHLFLKLQAWSDHRSATRTDLQLKQYTDRRDIDELLEIAHRSADRLRSSKLKWLPESMVSAAATRLQEYLIRGSPATRGRWEALGFVVQSREYR